MRTLRPACLFVIFFGTMMLAQSNPVPLLNQPLVPAVVAPGSGKFTLTINGTGFVAGAVVNWNGASRVTTVVSGSEVKATINASDVTKAKTASVTVVNPAPGGGTSNVVYFPVRKSAPSLALGRKDEKGAYPWGFVVGDFNKDGKLDVAAGKKTTGGAGAIQLLLGNGNGTFKAPIESASTPPYGPRYAGDFNKDGKLDLLAAGPNLKLTTFLGNGNGKFVQEPSFYACDECNAQMYTSVADFNGDGNLDVCVIGPDDREGVTVVGVYLGVGKGKFEQIWFGNTLNDERGIATIGDFNRDGILDLAVPDGEAVDIFLGNGDGTFQKPVAYQTANGAGAAVVTADVNGDGKLDLITAAGSVMLGNGDGTFRANGGPGPVSGYNFFVGDFNGDGILDLVGYTGNVQILLGIGDGTFQSALEFPGPSPNPDSQYPVFGIGDFNGDGKLDVVSAGTVNGNSVLSVFLQK
jgi:FG-GAP-like repeat